MIANRRKIHAVGAGICKVGLVFIGLGFFVQILNNFFYRQPFDRLFYLGTAFILTFALSRTFRAMELRKPFSPISRQRPVRRNDLRGRLPATTYPHHPR